MENIQHPTSNTQHSTSRAHAALGIATEALLAELNADGHWTGQLSASALSTATAVVALSTVSDEKDRGLIAGGLRWLAQNGNADGGWGDTVKSRSNISTTALCWAAFGAARADGEYRDVVAGAVEWLAQASGEIPGSIRVSRVGHGVHAVTDFPNCENQARAPCPEDQPARSAGAELLSVARTAAEVRRGEDAPNHMRDAYAPRNLPSAIAARYGKDRTFSVPILMTLALSGRIGWEHVLPLPFELAALPHQFFGALQLPVVSYALPALIAIGQTIHHHRPSRNPVACLLRAVTKRRTLRVLESIQPPNGGFLEATPLTSFVTMSLASMGLAEHRVTRRAVTFLRNSAQPDGSWAIDTNLATWVTTLAIKALPPGRLTPEQRLTLREWLLGQQYRKEHPSTHAAPGGWAWTDLPGGVPDADDTPGALLALLDLGTVSPETHAAGVAGVQWLLGLQNRDGGIPTFCRGWGALPFDRSSPDLTAHTLRAWSAWHLHLPQNLRPRVDRAISRGLEFLAHTQRPDGTWLPLWFGNEHSPDDENFLYGTTHVLIALRELDGRGYAIPEGLIRRATERLVAMQNADGGWNGGAGGPSSVEETALAVEALAGTAKLGAVERGVEWLVAQVESGTWRAPAPIGFYFAKLWYYERLYPLIFTVGALRKVVALERI